MAWRPLFMAANKLAARRVVGRNGATAGRNMGGRDLWRPTWLGGVVVAFLGLVRARLLERRPHTGRRSWVERIGSKLIGARLAWAAICVPKGRLPDETMAGRCR